MQFKNIVAIIASLALVEAFKFTAEEVQDGIYAIKTDTSGKEYMEYLGPGNTTKPTTWDQRRDVHPKLMERDSSGCSTHTLLNSASTDAANNMLQNHCGSGTLYSSDKLVFTSGSVFASTCDYTGGQECFKSESIAANSETTAVCGFYITGCDNKNYGYDAVGTSFCGNLG